MSPRVIMRLKGGLGNQLFQYAFGLAVSRRTGAELVLDTVSGFVRDATYRRGYALDFFEPAGRLASPSERLVPFARVRRSTRRLTSRVFGAAVGGYLSQTNFVGYWPAAADLNPKRSIIVEGYWQSPKYFADVESEIRRQLRPPEAFAEALQNRLVVHVRDFGQQSARHAAACLPPHYFVAASRLASEQCSVSELILVSDNLTGPYVQSVIGALQGLSIPIRCVVDWCAHEVLWALGSASAGVLSKSTLSWWGGWLGERRGVVVVAPKSTSPVDISAWDPSELIPSNWLTA